MMWEVIFLAKNIDIYDGAGTASVINGSYMASADVNGYDSTSISPASVTVKAGVAVYDFTISATGTLILHVTEDKTPDGTPVEGAVFYRCDSTGTAYGDPIITDATGTAVFYNVPYESTGTNVYFKQTASDGEHEFEPYVKTVSMVSSTKTKELINPPGAIRTFRLTDENYPELPIKAGTLTLE